MVVYYECQMSNCGLEHWIVGINPLMLKLTGVEAELKKFCDFVLEKHREAYPCVWGGTHANNPRPSDPAP